MIQGIKNEDVDLFWMSRALKIAAKAGIRGEVPVGAVLVKAGRQVAAAGNRRETLPSPIGHAEILCVHRAALELNAWRLVDCTLYVTLEPCLMCAGALVQSRISRLVYGAADPKGGAIHTLYQVAGDSRLNHQFEVTSGIMARESTELLQGFFRTQRLKKKLKSV